MREEDRRSILARRSERCVSALAPRPRLTLMPNRLVRDFPLFPLGIVALPQEYVPLHIFEERYRTMIGEVLEADSEFGIIWQTDDETKPVGCACIVTEVLERMDDGRMNIVTRGTRPFRLVREQDDLPY